MRLNQVLDVAQKFIIFSLFGKIGTLEPTKANLDFEKDAWILEFSYMNWKVNKSMIAFIEISNQTGEIISFNTKTV